MGKRSFLTYKLENRSFISCRAKIFLQNVRRKFLRKNRMKQCLPSPRKEKFLLKDRRNDRPPGLPRKSLQKNRKNNLPLNMLVSSSTKPGP
jgi:hypothetical protein